VGGGQVGHALELGQLVDLDLALERGGAAAGGEQLAIGRDGQAGDAVGEAIDLADDLARFTVPDGDLLEAAADDELAIGAEGDRLDEAAVGGAGGFLLLAVLVFHLGGDLVIDECLFELGLGELPELEAVAAAGGEELAVG